MPELGGPSPSELSRQVRDVLSRLEGLIRQVEERYVRKDLLDVYKESISSSIKSMEDSLKGSLTGIQNDLSALSRDKVNTSDLNNLEKRVVELEDNNKWLFRLIIGFIVLAVLGVVVTTGGGVGK